MVRRAGLRQLSARFSLPEVVGALLVMSSLMFPLLAGSWGPVAGLCGCIAVN